MSSQDISWSTLRQDLTTTPFAFLEGAKVSSYSPKKQEFSFAYNVYGAMLDHLFVELQSTVQKRAGGQEAVAVNLEKTKTRLQEYSLELIQAVSLPEKKEQKGDCKESIPTGACGLSSQEQIAAIKKTHDFLIKWFSQQCTEINNKQYWLAEVPAILEKTWHHNPDMHSVFYKEFHLRRSKDPVSFTQEDRIKFGIKEGEKLVDATKINCAEFALLKLREVRAKDFIFFAKQLPMKDLVTTLKTWGYQLQDTPQPHDLVVYLDDQGIAQHLGRFLKNGLVESKLGHRHPHFFWHQMFDVPSHYGKKVIFLRRPSSML